MNKIDRDDNLLRVSRIYDSFDESSRLSTKATGVEFLTTIRYIEKYLKPGMKILDIGAGVGDYSIYLAKKGFEVVSVELLEKHVLQIKEKISADMNIEVYQGDARELSMLEEDYFDIVLCFGPLYHLEDYMDKSLVLNEVKRLMKDNGLGFMAFISNDMVIVTETMLYNDGFLLGSTYNHETLEVLNEPFVFNTVGEARDILTNNNLEIVSEIGVDGLSELLAEKINSMDESEYKKWLNYHFYICEKPEFIGASNHLLFIVEQNKK